MLASAKISKAAGQVPGQDCGVQGHETVAGIRPKYCLVATGNITGLKSGSLRAISKISCISKVPYYLQMTQRSVPHFPQSLIGWRNVSKREHLKTVNDPPSKEKST
jgi:hypothetical protein